MSATKELIKYVNSLTQEQVDKIIEQLPRLTAMLEEPKPPCSPGETPQTQ